MASSSSEPGKSEAGDGSETPEATVANEEQLRLKKTKKDRVCSAKERISKMPPSAAGKRSSIYRGVTRHRWTGRYEAHLWDKSTWNQNQNKKGKQVYLGAYDDEEAAARAYDLAALKYWGPSALINFPVTDYARDLEEMQTVSREEYLASLRRKSSGFSRGLSKYRGLSSRWDPTYGRMAGSNNFNSIYYGEDSTAETEYLSSFCIARKIDLTSYIKWLGSNASARFSDVKKHGFAEDICYELDTLEQKVHRSEPYQLLALGMPHERRKHERSSVSALSILSHSAAYRNLQQKASKKQENKMENDENENKNTITKLDHGNAAEKSLNNDGDNEGLDIAMGMSGSLPLQRTVYPLTQLLSAPLFTASSTVDPSLDPVLWTPHAPVLPSGLSGVAEVGIVAEVLFFLDCSDTELEVFPRQRPVQRTPFFYQTSDWDLISDLENNRDQKNRGNYQYIDTRALNILQEPSKYIRRYSLSSVCQLKINSSTNPLWPAFSLPSRKNFGLTHNFTNGGTPLFSLTNYKKFWRKNLAALCKNKGPSEIPEGYTFIFVYQETQKYDGIFMLPCY